MLEKKVLAEDIAAYALAKCRGYSAAGVAGIMFGSVVRAITKLEGKEAADELADWIRDMLVLYNREASLPPDEPEAA